ncbi:MAG: chlorophyllide reductase subunit Z, partial [Pseudomonadota bacterium]
VRQIPWEGEAERALEARLEAVPVLTRISAAKRLRDAAEAVARAEGAGSVATKHLEEAAASGLAPA